MKEGNKRLKKTIYYRIIVSLGCLMAAALLFISLPQTAQAKVIGSKPAGSSGAAAGIDEEGDNGGDNDEGGNVEPEEGGDGNAVLSTGGEARVTSATITTESVNVRKEASTSSGVAGKATKGMEVTVTGEETGSDGKVWYAVSFDNNGANVTGYIRSDLVEAHESTPEPEPAPEETTPPETEDQQSAPPSDDYYVQYAEDEASGSSDWYLFDNNMGKKYKVSDLLGAQELSKQNEETMAKQTGTLKLIIVVMAVVILILVAVVTVFIIKLRGAYSNDDYDDDEDDDDDYDDDDEEDEDDEEERPRKRRFGKKASRRAKYDDDEDDDDYDEDEDDEEDEEEDYRPRKKTAAKSRRSVKKKPKSGKRYEEDEDDVEDDEDDEEEEYRPRRGKSSGGQKEKGWQSKNFLDDDDLEFEFLDFK